MSTAELDDIRARWHTQAVRGCMLCDYGIGPEDDRRCRHTEVARGGAPVEVHAARGNTGQCGPEARHMHFVGLYSR